MTRYFVKVYLNAVADAKYVPYVRQLMSNLFTGVPVTCQQRPARGTTEIQVSSRDVCEYLKVIGFDPKHRYIPKWVLKNEAFSKAVVKGLFDTEGSVGIKYFIGKRGNYLYKQLTVTNRNKNILRFLETSLSKFGYRPTKNSRKNIYLSNEVDIKKYMDDIGSNNPKLIKKIKVEELNGFIYGGLRRIGKAPVLKTGTL